MKAACSAATSSRVRASSEPATDWPLRRTSTSCLPVSPARLGCSTEGTAPWVTIGSGSVSAERRAVLSMVIGRGPAAAATVPADNNALHTANVMWP